MAEEYESHLQPFSQPACESDFNEMAAAVATAICMWALTTLIAVVGGYHGGVVTNTINLLVVAAGALGYLGRRWQLRRRYRSGRRTRAFPQR